MFKSHGLRRLRLQYRLKVGLVCLAIGFPSSSFAANDSSMRPAEQWILQKVAAGENADLEKEFPHEADRVIRSSFLKRLLTKDIPGAKVRAWGVLISHAIVRGRLDLTNEEIPYRVGLADCMFEDSLILLNAHFKSDLHLDRSTFAGIADFRYAVIDGDLEAKKAYFMDEDLTINAADGREQSKKQIIDFERMKVAGPVYLDETVFDPAVHFYGVEVAGTFVANKAKFNGSADFELMKVTGHAMFNETVFNGQARFYRSKFAENFEVDGAQFNDVESGANFLGMSASTASFSHAIFNGPVIFYGSNFANNFEANDAQFNYPKDYADLRSMIIGGHASFAKAVFNGAVNFFSTRVDGSFYARDASFNEDRRGVAFNEMKVDTVEFQGATFKGPIEVSGMTYREVSSGGLEHFRGMLRQAKYDAGAYAELEDYYRRRGIIDQADQVYIEQRQRERSNLWMPQRWFETLVFDIGVGYGRHPWRVLIWSGFVLLVGCYVFRSRRLMDPQKLEYKKRPYSRFLYSLDLFLPIVDLQFASVWMPKQGRRAARRYLPVHVIAGWILITILVAALTGILK